MNTADLGGYIMYASTYMNILRLFFCFFFIACWLCLQVHVIYGLGHFSLPPLPPHDPRLTAPERGCGVWGESRVMEAHHSRNWNGNFLIQEDDLCSHRNPRLYWMINMEKIVPSNTLWCVHGVHVHWSVHFLFFLLFLLPLFLFHFIKTRLWYANCENHFLTSRMCRTWQRRMCSESVMVTFSTYDNVPLKF